MKFAYISLLLSLQCLITAVPVPVVGDVAVFKTILETKNAAQIAFDADKAAFQVEKDAFSNSRFSLGIKRKAAETKLGTSSRALTAAEKDSAEFEEFKMVQTAEGGALSKYEPKDVEAAFLDVKRANLEKEVNADQKLFDEESQRFSQSWFSLGMDRKAAETQLGNSNRALKKAEENLAKFTNRWGARSTDTESGAVGVVHTPVAVTENVPEVFDIQAHAPGTVASAPAPVTNAPVTESLPAHVDVNGPAVTSNEPVIPVSKPATTFHDAGSNTDAFAEAPAVVSSQPHRTTIVVVHTQPEQKTGELVLAGAAGLVVGSAVGSSFSD